MARTKGGTEVHYRIGNISAGFMYGLGAFGWIIGLLLALTGIGEIGTEIMNVLGQIAYFFWYALLGVNYFSGKTSQKLGIIGVGSIVSLIPFVNAIVPTFVLETWAMIRTSRKEDEERAEKESETVTKTAQEIQQQNFISAQAIRRVQS